MKTYREYYKLAEQDIDFDSGWWRKKKNLEDLKVNGDYIETVKFLDFDKKNDSSTYQNHINVKNSKLSILLHMLVQQTIDWCIENDKSPYEYGIEIRRELDEKMRPVYLFRDTVHERSYKDDDIENSMTECTEILCDTVTRFIEDNGKNIPNDWNVFMFGIDGLPESINYKKWVAFSDASMCLGNLSDDREYEDFFELL